MKWRDIFLGAIATLIVTVVGGLIIYYLTRESPPPPPVEKLVYDIDKPVTFDSDQTTMSFINVRAKNTGEKPATNVIIGVEFDDKVEISDKRITLSSGPAGRIDAQPIGGNKLEVQIAAFTPNETATIAILTDTADGKDPTVGIKSDASTGERGPLNSVIRVSPTRNSEARTVIGTLIPIAILAQGILLLLFFRHRASRSLRRIIPASRDINNTAFVFLHSGLTEQAVDLLSKSIRDSGAEPYMLANYGLALGLNGDTTQSQKLFEAAKFWADVDSHAQAVVAFNRSLLAFKQNDEANGITLMRRAFELSKKEISRYASYSTIVASLREENAELHSFMNEQGVGKKN